MPGCLGRIPGNAHHDHATLSRPPSSPYLFANSLPAGAGSRRVRPPNALCTNQESQRHHRPSLASQFSGKSSAHSKEAALPTWLPCRRWHRDKNFRGAHQLASYYSSWSVKCLSALIRFCLGLIPKVRKKRSLLCLQFLSSLFAFRHSTFVCTYL